MLGQLLKKLRDSYAKWRHKSRYLAILNSLGTCGSNLYFDDVSSVVFNNPKNLHFGSEVGFNVHVFIHGMGGVQIGDNSRFGPFVVIHSGDHRIDDVSQPIRTSGHKTQEIIIGKDVWVGAHAVILRGSVIPDHCVIGAGAVVDRHLRLNPYDIVRGNPAEVVGNRLHKHGNITGSEENQKDRSRINQMN